MDEDKNGSLGYFISYYPIELEIENLNSTPTSTDKDRITKGAGKAINVTLQAEGTGLSRGVTELSNVTATVTLTSYSITLTKIPVKGATSKKYVTVALTGTGQALTITLTKTEGGNGTITGTKAALTSKDVKLTLNLGTGSPPTSNPIKVYSANVTVAPNTDNSGPVTITLQSIQAEGTVTSSTTTVTINSVEITIPVKIDIKETGKDEGAANPEHKTITSVQLILPVPTDSSKNNLQLSPRYDSGSKKTHYKRASCRWTIWN